MYCACALVIANMDIAMKTIFFVKNFIRILF